jgi:hypothetical protein
MAGTRRARIDPGTMEDIGTLWSMQHGDRRARCALLSSSGGWEIRALVDGATLLAQACEGPAAAFSLAEEWKRRLSVQGWREIRPDGRGAGMPATPSGAGLT